jgi:hypothetical protein
VRRAWSALLLAAGLGAIGSGAQSSAPSADVVLKEMDVLLAKRQQIDRALLTVLGLRRLVIRAEGVLAQGTTELPSRIYARLAGAEASPKSEAVAQLLEAARQPTAPLPSSISVGCDRPMRQQPRAVVRNARNESAAKRLDALVRIEFAPCGRGRQINSPDAGAPSTASFALLNSEAEKRRREEVNAAIRVVRPERLALAVAQSFRFSDASDAAIPIPAYVRQQADVAITRNGQLLAAVTAHPLPAVVYDRTKTSGADDPEAQRKGWFAASFDPGADQLYMSPTLMRAALVECAALVSYDLTLTERLRDRRKDVDRGYLTPADVWGGIVKTTQDNITAMDECIVRELDFLVAHELAHADVNEESRADCVGAAVVRRRGHASLGVFGTVIFDVAAGEDFPVLGVNEELRQQLVCRAGKINSGPLNESVTDSEFAQQVRVCEQAVPVCQ